MLRRGGPRLTTSSKPIKVATCGDLHNFSHIDYMFIKESQTASAKRFGIDADGTLMHDIDHAVL